MQIMYKSYWTMEKQLFVSYEINHKNNGIFF